MSVKTRFAPSPTGSLHVGGARTALFNWLFARHEGGEFILRVEDTDAERSEKKFLSEIIDSLRWLGIEWDGEPLSQSARLDIYGEYVRKLLETGAAFKCYMTPEDLEAERKSAQASGGHFRYKREWAERGKKDGAPFAVRFAVPRVQNREDNPLADSSGEIIFTDLLRGNMGFSTDEVEDFVIMRPDGMPTYNFACAIDDALCEITHVIRGDEHLVNAPKQILLLKALGLDIPAFVHLPVILAPDGSKLSKRHGVVSVADFRDSGILPSGLANYIARLGWSHGDEEIFTISELIEKFDIRGFGISPSNFDEEKMRWVNGVHIRKDKADVAKPLRKTLSEMGFYVSPEDAKKAVELLKERAETINEMAEKSVFLFAKEVKFDEDAKKKFLNPETLPALEAVFSALSKPGAPFDEDGLKGIFSGITEETGLKMKQIAQPLRVALTGKTESPGIYETVSALGREKTVSRLENAIKIAKAGE
ncbi:MAG: glutamate--tRNA ligase [Candidatus Mycalebacterium zealandia]|nr:MAG: glutamate--tRNA ligase [Candidatus Mycalebacterium zealandia]